MRRLIERLSRGVVLRRRLPERFGKAPIFVSPDSALSYWKRDLEPLGRELFDFADRFVEPGDHVWDVGANVGLFTYAAAQRAGSEGAVLAFEPDGFSASLLRRTERESTGRAERSSVEILPVAVSTGLDLLGFSVAERGRSSSHLTNASGNSQSGGARETTHVMAVSLDWMLERRTAPDVVKIDVEGAEVEVLEGAERLLAEARPALLCEVGSASADRVSAILARHGYELRDWGAVGRPAIDRAAFSTLAVPRERARNAA